MLVEMWTTVSFVYTVIIIFLWINRQLLQAYNTIQNIIIYVDNFVNHLA